MKRGMASIVWIVMAFLMTWASADSAFAEAPATETTAIPPLDVVTLNDGSVIYGEVIEMADGLLQIKSSMTRSICTIITRCSHRSKTSLISILR